MVRCVPCLLSLMIRQNNGRPAFSPCLALPSHVAQSSSRNSLPGVLDS